MASFFQHCHPHCDTAAQHRPQSGVPAALVGHFHDHSPAKTGPRNGELLLDLLWGN